jgi:hypothetical protein
MDRERKLIPGLDGRYEIDKQGNVYATFAFKHLRAGRLMKSRPNNCGYVFVVLAVNGGKTFFVHRLLMMTFNPNENAHKLEVNHKDGNRGNNSLDNLEWMTRVENMKHAHHVLKTWDQAQVRGEQVGGVKLTAEKVIEIRRLWASGVQRSVIAAEYGVTPENITAITKRKSWAHVE